ncbi:MAG TPA: tripartite tricarboxylate transporter substrate binding protein [Xanthobacteraceae bacterium]|nr:tripartite tricarboxylate transporter substrate binding protein [Xanthobacteraceae bacterium]
MTLLARCLVIATALMLTARPSTAQDFSAKPIRIIVGLVAGGATDVTARLVAQKLTESLHTSVYVDNRPGGIFIPATRELIGAPPDGHTLLMISTSNVITQPFHPDYPIDLRTLTPITEVSAGPLILVARKELPVKSIADLIAYGRQNPGKLTFGSGGGTGSSLYLAAELLRLKTQIQFQNVPYRGAAAALNDLLGAHIDLMFDAMPVMSQQAKAGNVTPLAVTSAQRSPVLPDVPTMMEAGLKDFEVVNYFGLFAPPGTSPAVAQQLRDAVAKMVAAPDMVEKFAEQGMAPVASEPGDFAKLLAAELDRWGQVIKAAGIKPE